MQLLGQSDSVTLQIKSIGLPFITTYGPSDYGMSNQVFDVLIGDDDKIYFANNGGILVFDGVNWTRVFLPKKAEVYALTKADDGVIYVGGTNEFGYLSTTDKGQLKYVSLIELLGDVQLESFVSLPVVSGNTIIFSAGKKTILYDKVVKKVDIIDYPDASGSFYTLIESQGSIYTYSRDTLFQLKEKQWLRLRPATISYEFGRGHLIDISDNQTIAVTTKGFFDFDTETKIDIPVSVEEFLQESIIYSTRLLQDSYLAICTWSGLLITDLAGNPIQFINKVKGLPDNFLFNAALDHSNMLWVATNNGIAQIDLFSSYSIFDERLGLEGVITDTQLYNEHIYLSSVSGVFLEKWTHLSDPFYTPNFKKLSPAISHGMIRSEDELIFFTELSGNLSLSIGAIEEIEGTQDEIFWSGFKSRHTDDLFLGSYSGKLIHLTKENSKWNIKAKLDPDFLNARYMAEGAGNEIWVSNVNEGIFKLNYNRQKAELLNQQQYGEADGLPSDQNNYEFTIDSKPLFASRGIYKYDERTDRFVMDTLYSEFIGDEPISLMVDSEGGDIYYFTEVFNMLKKTNNGYEKISFPSIDFQKYLPIDITAVDEENVLISSLNAVIHVDPKQPEPPSDFQVSFSNISSLTSDSVFYGGFGSIQKDLHLAAADNGLRLAFTSTYYKNPEANEYKWRLLGFDPKWSSWSTENKKDYTNLPHGAYTFEVVGKNIFGTESKPVAISFLIITPWYFTLWAYALYLIIIGLFIWSLVVFYTRKLRADRDQLELIVQERTKVINDQKEIAEEHAVTISAQHDKLVQMDEMKDKFFLNISHELRTPLTLSMGNVEQMMKGNLGNINDQQQESLNTSYRNSQRLLKMVNNILDISKLEGGKIKLQAVKTKPTEILAKVVGFFSSKFLDKNLTLKRAIESDVELYIDKNKFETIFINLITNAFKFTPAGGFIEVGVSENSQEVIFIVEDNGIGIPSENLPFVFDRFYQAPHGLSDEGTGIGLALARELVMLHGGDISVASEINQGTTFTLTFKKGKTHLDPSQISAHQFEVDGRTMEDKYPLIDHLGKASAETTSKLPNPLAIDIPHLLLVEDNPEMSKYIIGLLASDFHISLAENGQEGLDFLITQTPDLIITDWLMPEMDGYEMATAIKKSEKLAFIPMIFLTARAQEQDKINVLNMGVDDYLFKPFNAEELKIRIKNLLKNKKERSEFLVSESIEPNDIEWNDFPSKLKQDLDAYLSDHIKGEITGEALAQHVNQSKRTLYRKIKANTGLSVFEYIKEYRLRKARTILENQEYHTVSEVSYQVGFNYPSHFSTAYKERFGKQPSEYLE